MDCCLCDAEISVEPLSGWDKGHNAEPLAKGRCCSSCNDYVVAKRIRLLYQTKENAME